MSTIVSLIGPIEWWWDAPEDPNRFNSKEAVTYRRHREYLCRELVAEGYLVYRPHEAFKGTWDERAQALNDVMVQISDIIVCMRPEGIPGQGTDHELDLATQAGKPIVMAPPGRYIEEVVAEIEQESK